MKKLIPMLHHAIAEYHSHSQPLGDHLAGGFDRSRGRAGEDDPVAGSLPGDGRTHGAPERAGRHDLHGADGRGQRGCHGHGRLDRRPAEREAATATTPERQPTTESESAEPVARRHRASHAEPEPGGNRDPLKDTRT